MVKSTFLLICLLILKVALATPSFKPGVRIINGKSAEPGQFPFIVSLQGSDVLICSGSIINKNWILTAGYCALYSSYTSIYILAGTNFLDYSAGTIYNVTKIVSHPDFTTPDFKNDIGLIKINKDIEFNDLVQPIDIGYAEINDTVTVVGWGKTEDSYPSKDLRYIQQRALSLVECQVRAQNYMGAYYLGYGQVCALASDNNKGPCYLDAGGPLISNGKLVGIFSFMFSPCANGIPDVYTRPSVYIEWINKNIEN